MGQKLPQILLVIFDCDGVLVDSEYLSAKVLIEVFAEIGIALDLPFVYANFVGHSFATVAAKYARLHGENVKDSFEEDYRNRLLESFKELDQRRTHYSLAVQEAFTANESEDFHLIGTLADSIQVEAQWVNGGKDIPE